MKKLIVAGATFLPLVVIIAVVLSLNNLSHWWGLLSGVISVAIGFGIAKLIAKD